MAKKKRKNYKVDFGHKDAKSTGGGNPRLPENDYIAEIDSVKHDTAQSGNPMFVWKLKITEGKHEGKVITTRTVLIPKSLWVLRNLLEAIGVKVPEKAVNLDPAKYVGKELGITLEDGEPYGDKGRISSDVTDFMDADVVRSGGVDEDEDEEDEDDEDTEDEDDDEEEEEDEDDDDEDEDEDEEEIEEVDLDEL